MALDAYTALKLIHRSLSVPFDWDADVLDEIAEIMQAAGYSFPNSDEAAALEEAHQGDFVPLGALIPWTPNQ